MTPTTANWSGEERLRWELLESWWVLCDEVGYWWNLARRSWIGFVVALVAVGVESATANHAGRITRSAFDDEPGGDHGSAA